MFSDSVFYRETELKFHCKELEEQVSRLHTAFDSANKMKDEAMEQKIAIETQ